MPFSHERTELIVARLHEHLGSSSIDEWQRSFYTSMLRRFERDGPATNLSDAQYKKLHQLLNLSSEKDSKTTNSTRSKPSKPFAVKYKSSPRRRSSTRRTSRKLIFPIWIMFGLLALLVTIFNGFGASNAPTRTADNGDSSVTFYVTGSSVNQRVGPSTQNEIMGQLKQGTRVSKMSEQGGWTKISSHLGIGWMSSRFLSAQSSPPQRSATSTRAVQSLSASSIRVIDGDTIDLSGQAANVRLVGFNAPEVGSPQCSAELNAGRRATARLNSLIQSATSIELERVRCACRLGTEGTRQCNFGRQCGKLFVNGSDVGQILISAGLAVRYICGRTSCPPRTNSWCQ